MPGFVKTKKDEEIWRMAKKSAESAGVSGRSFWAYANSVFHRMKGIKESSDYPLTSFRTWFDDQPDILKRIKPYKNDTTWIRSDSGKKRTKITVWGAPADKNYTRG